MIAIRGSRTALILALIAIMLTGLLQRAAGSADGPAIASKGSNFWVAFPRLGETEEYVNQLYITSTYGANVTVTAPSVGFTQGFAVGPAGGVKVDLPNGLLVDHGEVIQPKGIHITSDSEVSVYPLFNAIKASDGYTALPTSALGRDYMVCGIPTEFILIPTYFAVLGTANGTTVTITPSITANGHPEGVPYVITLNAGDVYQIEAPTTRADFTGTRIQSDQPVAVYGGSEMSNMPFGVYSANALIEQMPPIPSAGLSFLAVPTLNRTADTIRVYGIYDSTVITVGGTNAVLNPGQVFVADISAATAITSDKGVFVFQFSRSYETDMRPGDPTMILVPAINQYLNDYVVMTPSEVAFDETPHKHYFNLVVADGQVSQVRLDGSGLAFSPIPGTGYSSSQVQVGESVHHVSTLSGAPVGVFVYGFGTRNAYGYAAGLGLGANHLLTISPSAVVGLQSSTGAITLSAPAPIGGSTVSISSDDPAVATSQSWVTIPQGMTKATFPISTSRVTSPSVVTFTSNAAGVENTAELAVRPNEVANLTFDPSPVVGGNISKATVTLAVPAPPGGTLVRLASLNTSIATVPATITVAAGQKTALFNVTTALITSDSNAIITATLNGVVCSRTLPVIQLRLIGFSLSVNSTYEGQSVTAKVTLNAPARSGGFIVSLTNSNSSAATVPSSVTIPAGASFKSFTIPTKAVMSIQYANLTAKAGSVSLLQALTVVPITITNIHLNNSSVTGGASVAGAVQIAIGAPTGGYKVTLTSDNPAATVPTSVTIPAGGTSASFKVSTKPVGGTAFANIAGSRGTSHASAQLIVLPPEVATFTVTPATVKGGLQVTGKVTLTGKVPVGGITLHLETTASYLAAPPTSVSIPAGATSASFKINTFAVTGTSFVILRARVFSVTKSVTVTLTH